MIEKKFFPLDAPIVHTFIQMKKVAPPFKSKRDATSSFWIEPKKRKSNEKITLNREFVHLFGVFIVINGIVIIIVAIRVIVRGDNFIPSFWRSVNLTTMPKMHTHQTISFFSFYLYVLNFKKN
jgi:hypothetical protein